MSESLPFMNSTGLIKKILDRVIEASRPSRFTHDFLGTKLGYSSGSAAPIVPLMKRLGFIASDGSPTELYDKFRSDSSRGAAMAQGLRNAYSELFSRNEYVYNLTRDKLRDMVVEITGLEKGATRVKAIVGTFEALKQYADFEQEELLGTTQGTEEKIDNDIQEFENPKQIPIGQVDAESVGLNLSYTINLNLPETSDIEVFNAIFRSLKENLLKK